MEGYEDDDDTHFCIKCHATINGLENYVRHRQSGCQPTDDKSVHGAHQTPTTVSYPEILNADAFFSSLELQSSSKTNTRRSRTLLESGQKLKKDDKKRRGRKFQSESEEATGGKVKLPGMLPEVTDLDDPTEHLCIPSLVGFPDIVSSGKSTAATGGQSKLGQPGPSHASAKIEGPSSYPAKHEPENALEGLIVDGKPSEKKRQESDNPRIEHEQQAWLEDTILTDLVVANNESKDLARYEFGYHQDDDSEDDILDEDVADEESYIESDEPDDREHPPRGHTGGKWKPGLDGLPQDIHEDDAELEDDHSEHPPPTYTGGKWKPTDTSQVEEYESKGNQGTGVGEPPPGHTRGKWVPGARTDIDTGYWCNPCGRRLASRLVYNRHLRSDLHARRCIREIDGTPIHLPRGLAPKKTTSHRRMTMMAEKARAKVEPVKPKKSRRREKEVLACEMCHARVRRAQMGKHLLSHYHCRVAGASPSGPGARRFLLENIGNVVRQCPFQCASCRFYCNTEETFLLHWRSEIHSKTVQQINGSYRCAPCGYRCEDNATMESHLLSVSHRDVVFMMNGSVPVVISRHRALPCGVCERRFRYNVQLRIHARETGHAPASTATDDYQQRIVCRLCGQVLRSMVSLQRHQLAHHAAKDASKNDEEDRDDSRRAMYFCSFCSMNFDTPRDAVLHRRTVAHKETRKARKLEGAAGSTIRDCPHCGQSQVNLVKYKEHLLECHPELCHRCAQCGTLFALPQDVTRHTRTGNCAKSENPSVGEVDLETNDWRCARCGFATDSRAEFIFHEALHVGSVTPSEDEPGGSRQLPKYRCPVCRRIFAKVSLRNHIRSHTGERPFPCAKCFLAFARRSDLKAHQRECLAAADGQDAADRRRNFSCSECNDAFYTKHALRQHMLRHAGKKYKCGLPGCPTSLRTASELRSHRMLVHESTPADRRYACALCPYAAKTNSQLRRHKLRHENAPCHACPYAGCNFKTKLGSHLRRHARLHIGTKPYKCRHCSYASNNLENLRKHVLSTNLHPGKTIYECDFCAAKKVQPFGTNFSKELRAHLLESHQHEFPTPGHASNYVSQIFEGPAASSMETSAEETGQ